MGKQNRQRRAARARERAKRRAAPTRPHWARPDPAAEEHDPGPRAEPESSAGLDPAVDQLLAVQEAELTGIVGVLWEQGWQPAEVIRQVRRASRGPGPEQIIRHAIAADHVRRPSGTLDPRWVAQIDRLDLPVADRRGGWLPRLCRQLDDPTVAVAGLIRALHTFRPLLRLIPPPGRSECDLHVRVGDGGNGPRDGRHVTDPVLQRVRALLAKAEATTYPAEAEAFTAKAHELMTRHAIDAALVARAGRRGQCGAIRIPIDEPYLDAKVLLLHTLSEHSRCRSISHGALALCTVVGDPDDLFAVQLLFTSLLLQAQQAVLAESTGTDAGAHRRSRAFRSSFLRAYAVRIGERLADVGAEVAADVERSTGTEVLPVLVERRRMVDDAVEQLFGDVRPVRSRGGQDAAGWHRGRQAADRARLSSTDLPPAPSGRGALPAGALDTAS